MPAERQAAEILTEAIREAALELALVIGLEGLTAPSIDRDQVPAAVWNAADAALQFLTAGLGIAEDASESFNEDDFAHYLEKREARDAG